MQLALNVLATQDREPTPLSGTLHAFTIRIRRLALAAAPGGNAVAGTRAKLAALELVRRVRKGYDRCATTEAQAEYLELLHLLTLMGLLPTTEQMAADDALARLKDEAEEDAEWEARLDAQAERVEQRYFERRFGAVC